MWFLSRTQTILDTCKTFGVKKIVFLSSGGAMYENAKELPTGEEYPAHPTSLYGLANLEIEKCIQDSGVPHVIARLANAYGPGQWESGFIPATILKMAKNESPIVHGSGSQTRDFIYISDVVQALILLAEKGDDQIYNIGSGQEIDLLSVVALVQELMGSHIEISRTDENSAQTQRSALNISKIKKEIGWSPKVDLKKGLGKTIDWYKSK